MDKECEKALRSLLSRVMASKKADAEQAAVRDDLSDFRQDIERHILVMLSG